MNQTTNKHQSNTTLILILTTQHTVNQTHSTQEILIICCVLCVFQAPAPSRNVDIQMDDDDSDEDEEDLFAGKK